MVISHRMFFNKIVAFVAPWSGKYLVHEFHFNRLSSIRTHKPRGVCWIIYSVGFRWGNPPFAARIFFKMTLVKFQIWHLKMADIYLIYIWASLFGDPGSAIDSL
jgi:hypothetical protein